MPRKVPDVESSTAHPDAPAEPSAPSDAPSVDSVTEQVMCWIGMSMRLASRRPMSDALGVLNDLGLTMPQVVALHVIAFEGTATMTQLVERVGLSPSAVSHLVHRLVGAGLCERKDDPVDRRQKRIRLTKDGQALMKRLMQSRVADTRTSIEPLHPATRQKLSEVLELVTAELADRLTAEHGPLPHGQKGPRSLEDVLAYIDQKAAGVDPDDVDDGRADVRAKDVRADFDNDLDALVDDVSARAARLGDAIAERAAVYGDVIAERAAAVGAAAGARVAKQVAESLAEFRDVHARHGRGRKR
jgi:DNA-binding MarR family transcriptional regulator